MPTTSQDQLIDPGVANRTAFLLLRWLLIILAGHLSLFTNIEEVEVGIFLLVVAFVISNILLAVMPLETVMFARSRHIVSVVDAVFIGAFLYYLRMPQAPIHLPFFGVVVLAIIWPNLRVVLFAMFVVSLLFGLLTSIEQLEDIFGEGALVRQEDFQTLALLCVVSIFYIFMLDRFDKDSETSAALIREKRNSENVVELTQRLSASLKANEIMPILLKRFNEMMPGVACSIVKVASSQDEAVVIAGAHPEMSKTLTFEQAPALNEAFISKETSTATPPGNSDRQNMGALAVPMVSRDEVVALLYFTHDGKDNEPLASNRAFVEIVASTAAHALSNAERFESMQELATSDSMTRLANHATFQTRLRHEVERARRHGRTVSLLMIDLDHLKRINDQYGHPVGDLVIGAVADAIRETCREIDFAARYGGEEFALILPETDLKSGIMAAERLRANVDAIANLETKVAVSIGVANCPLDAGTTEELIQAADNALYAAKGAGRNRVSPSAEEISDG